MRIGIVGILVLPVLFAVTAQRAEAEPREETALFAGGCVWCMEARESTKSRGSAR